jgi:hypothetical protein
MGTLAFATGATGCNGTLAYRRSTSGTVDSAFRRGAFDAIWTVDGSRQNTIPMRLEP